MPLPEQSRPASRPTPDTDELTERSRRLRELSVDIRKRSAEVCRRSAAVLRDARLTVDVGGRGAPRLSASLLIRPSAMLTREQRVALEQAAHGLPDSWRVVAYGDTAGAREAQRFGVRVVGPGFTTLSTFRPGVGADALEAFVERVRRERLNG
jgi:hypothetical protein